jgi:hypothetical protein
MKIRQGFVSNSSSCSFIICGFKLPEEKSVETYKKITKKTDEDIRYDMLKEPYYKDKKEIKDFDIEDYCQESLWEGISGVDIEMGEGVDGVVIGRHVTRCSDYGIDTAIWDLDELKNEVESIRKKMGFEDYPIKIYCGTKNC